LANCAAAGPDDDITAEDIPRRSAVAAGWIALIEQNDRITGRHITDIVRNRIVVSSMEEKTSPSNTRKDVACDSHIASAIIQIDLIVIVSIATYIEISGVG
jgi:hypothetical protein